MFGRSDVLNAFSAHGGFNQEVTASQVEQDLYFYEVPRIGKFIDSESRTEVTRGWQKGGKDSSIGTVSVWDDGKVLEVVSHDGGTTQ